MYLLCSVSLCRLSPKLCAWSGWSKTNCNVFEDNVRKDYKKGYMFNFKDNRIRLFKNWRIKLLMWFGSCESKPAGTATSLETLEHVQFRRPFAVVFSCVIMLWCIQIRHWAFYIQRSSRYWKSALYAEKWLSCLVRSGRNVQVCSFQSQGSHGSSPASLPPGSVCPSLGRALSWVTNNYIDHGI